MPIEERSLERAIGVLRDHLNGVLAKTISQARLIVFAVPDIDPPQIGVHLREGTAIGARLRSSYGSLRLLLTQRCISTVAGRGRRRTHTLHTVHYRYAIRAEDTEEPFIRWEYERDRPEGQWCRHHQHLSCAYLRSALDPSHGAWPAALKALATDENPLGRVESKRVDRLQAG